MRLTIFGSGYVGLVTGTCFAEMGNDVLCIDVDEEKVAALRQGQVTIFEPGLASMLTSNTERGNLRFSTDAEEGVNFGEFIFIAVGTPENKGGSADLKYVLDVADSIGTHLSSEAIVVDKSTVPVGTADQVRERIAAKLSDRGSSIPFYVVSNPEFLKEGAAVSDFMKPDRIIVGSDSTVAKRRLEQLYAPFNRNHDKIVHMDTRSAELTKYAANVMLATRISLMNELANLADHLDADIEAVRRGIGMDPRIGYHFIYAGTGYGGSCFPKDVKALIQTAANVGYEATITQGVAHVNAAQKRILFDKLMAHFQGNIKNKCFALWGLAFKPNTDDIREAPSQVLIELLTAHGARVQGYDPQANATAAKVFADNPAFSVADSSQEALQSADALILVTEWNEFRSPDFGAIKKALSSPVVFDGRNLYEPDHLRDLGFTYYGIGRSAKLT